MDFRLAKCARCDKLFNKIVSEVCNNCQPDEDKDFGRIQDVLAHESDFNVEQVAERAGVSLECVLRMLREGRIEKIGSDDKVTCGRCGAPAISMARRLCQKCLANLDRECANAINEMRQRLALKGSSDMNDVMAAVEQRRENRRQQRRDSERSAPTPVSSTRRMVMPEHLRRK